MNIYEILTMNGGYSTLTRVQSYDIQQAVQQVNMMDVVSIKLVGSLQINDMVPNNN